MLVQFPGQLGASKSTGFAENKQTSTGSARGGWEYFQDRNPATLRLPVWVQRFLVSGDYNDVATCHCVIGACKVITSGW